MRVKFSTAISLSIAVATATGCDEQTRESLIADTSPWTAEVATDPLTDERLATATARFSDGPFNVETTVSCRAGSTLRYRFSAFDQNDEGVELKVARFSPHAVPIYVYRYRLDDGEAVEGTNYGTRYANELTLHPDYTPTAARADRLVISIALTQGEVTLELDQTDASLRSVLDECSPGPSSAEPSQTEEPPLPENSADVAEPVPDVDEPVNEPAVSDDQAPAPGAVSSDAVQPTVIRVEEREPQKSEW